MSANPFPGPRPYTANDRDHFFGRETITRALESTILAHSCLTVFGPSGAGKSSLMHASVLPDLKENYGVRTVCIDSWPRGQSPARLVVNALHEQLRLGTPTPDLNAEKAIIDAANRAAMRSDQPVIIFLDQIEQLLFHQRSHVELREWVAMLDNLAAVPLAGFHIVLLLREDYLGPLQDCMHNRRKLTEHRFRVTPLTVGALVDATCKAARTSERPLMWSREQLRPLMLEIRVPGQAESDDAEAQPTYAQIVCRALFERRWPEKQDHQKVDAERIVQQYLEMTLAELGPNRDNARQLLEKHLVAEDGSRTLRTKKELSSVLPMNELGLILEHLEAAAILQMEKHEELTYYELGHDWLAKWLFKHRQMREYHEQQRRDEQRTLEKLTVVAMVVVAAVGAAGWYLAYRAMRAPKNR